MYVIGVLCDKMSTGGVLDLVLNAIISSNAFRTEDDSIWTTVARLVPSSSPEEVGYVALH